MIVAVDADFHRVDAPAQHARDMAIEFFLRLEQPCGVRLQRFGQVESFRRKPAKTLRVSVPMDCSSERWYSIVNGSGAMPGSARAAAPDRARCISPVRLAEQFGAARIDAADRFPARLRGGQEIVFQESG